MANEPMVTVALRRAEVWRGRAYGPGREVEVPKRAAVAWGVVGEGKEATSPKKASAKRGTK